MGGGGVTGSREKKPLAGKRKEKEGGSTSRWDWGKKFHQRICEQKNRRKFKKLGEIQFEGTSRFVFGRGA